MNDRVLVTGATGYVGEQLLRRLVADGVRAVGVGFSRTLDVPGASVIQLDLRDADRVAGLLRDVQPGVVFHCAADTDVAACQQHPELARGNIVDATARLVQAISDVVPGARLVALSTDLVFDGERAPYRENDLAGPVSIYGKLKLEAERPVLGFAGGSVLRTSLVYGRRGTHKGSFLAWMLGALQQGKPLTLFEDEFRTPIFVEDLCDAMVAVAERGLTGVWHVGGPERLSRVAIGKAVCRAFGHDESLLQPRRVADSTYAAPRARDVSLDSTKVWSALGRRPRAMAEALQQIAG